LSIRFSQRVSIPADVLIREIDGESVLLNLDTGRYHGLDEVGTSFWRALTTSASIEVAFEQLSSEYDVAPDVLRPDLLRLVEQLDAQGLIVLDAAE
jgi:hypothetical protein